MTLTEKDIAKSVGKLLQCAQDKPARLVHIQFQDRDEPDEMEHRHFFTCPEEPIYDLAKNASKSVMKLRDTDEYKDWGLAEIFDNEMTKSKKTILMTTEKFTTYY